MYVDFAGNQISLRMKMFPATCKWFNLSQQNWHLQFMSLVLSELLNCALFVGETWSFYFGAFMQRKTLMAFNFLCKILRSSAFVFLRKITSFRNKVPFHFGRNNNYLYAVQELYPEKGVGTSLGMWAYVINNGNRTLSTKVKLKTMTLLHSSAL